MFHFITWALTQFWSDLYIANQLFGIQVTYKGKVESKKETLNSQLSTFNFFLHPIIDEHSKSVKYFAFDEASQKETFLNLLKIQWIWPKVAFEIAHIEKSKISNAIENFDLAFFQSIPGIGPKTAKKILIELKNSFSDKDLIKINADDKLVKNITKTLTSMGYDKTKALMTLSKYPDLISTETLSAVLQWMIGELK